jgi:hypothetical protein
MMLATALLLARATIGLRDYPAEALRRHEQGDVGVEVRADARGRPFACRVTVRARSAALNRATCPLLLRRGRFPRLRNGKAFGLYRQFVSWRL